MKILTLLTALTLAGCGSFLEDLAPESSNEIEVSGEGNTVNVGNVGSTVAPPPVPTPIPTPIPTVKP
jgi:hypothetical protein